MIKKSFCLTFTFSSFVAFAVAGCQQRAQDTSMKESSVLQPRQNDTQNSSRINPMSKQLCLETIEQGIPCDKIVSGQEYAYRSACLKLHEKSDSYYAACGIEGYMEGETFREPFGLEWHIDLKVYYMIPKLTPAPQSQVPSGPTIEQTCAAFFARNGCNTICSERKYQYCRRPAETSQGCINRCEEILKQRP
jgi:hypothetical protein